MLRSSTIDCSPIDARSVHVHRDEPDGPFYVRDVRGT